MAGLTIWRMSFSAAITGKGSGAGTGPVAGMHQALCPRQGLCGKVTGIGDYGVFVNLAPGVDALTRHPKFERDKVKRGEKVLVQLPFRPVLNENVNVILQTLVFFQFACALRYKQKAFRIEPAAAPFTGQVTIQGDRRNVLVLRGVLDDQQRERIESAKLPMIVVAETLDQVKQQLSVHDTDKLLLDHDLNADFRFYRYSDGEWRKRSG